MGGALNELSQSQDSQPGLPRESDFDGQAGLATYVAPIFNAVAYPANLPNFKIEALEREAALIQQQPSHIVFLDNDSRSNPEAKAKREREADDRADVQIGIIMQNQQWEQERQREEWMRTEHSFAGQTLTGKQWSEIASDLKEGGTGHDWLIHYLMQHGQSHQDAEKAVKDMQLAASGMSKPARDRTSDEVAAMKRVKENPVAADAYDHYREHRSVGFDTVTPDDPALSRADRSTSVSARADALDGGITGAPDLTAHHRSAVAAIQPLDSRPAPLPPASQPMPSAAAGLDQ